MRRSVLLTVLLVLPALLYGQAEPAGSAKADRTEFVIGSKICFEIKFTSEKPVKVFFPSFSDSISKFQILSQSETDTIEQDNAFALRRTYNLITFDTGAIEIPTLAIMYEKEGFATLFPVFTAPVSFRSDYAQIDTSGDIKDLKQISQPTGKREQSKLLMYILTAIGILAILISLIIFWRRNSVRNIKKMPDAGLDPRARIILAQRAFSAGEIDSVMAVFALDSIMSENFDSASDSIGDLLELIERVKFAGYVPSRSETENAFNMAITCLDSTAGEGSNNEL
jgi:hypothetical protein